MFPQILRCLPVAAVCALPFAAVAQYENGSVVGTVHDSSGAVVPDAAVTVINRATGVASTRQSDAQGNYEVPALRVGQYDVRIEKAGFAPATATNITVTISARQRVDLLLNVGTEATVVEVSDVAIKVETDQSQRGQVITNYQTAALPLVSRNYSDLIGLVPGARAAGNSITTTSNTGLVREGSFNVNGQRSMFNNFLLDGLDNNAYGESNQGFSNQIVQPPPDSVAAFNVVTNNESAEYGRASGAVINVASLQGTNTLHGRVYEFIRNTDLNAVGYFRAPGGVKPQFNRNQFGGNVGGPILRDHFFVFVDYEGFRQVRKQVASATLPTPAQLNGNFASTVFDPYSGQRFAPNSGAAILASPDSSTAGKRIAALIAGLPGLTAGSSNNFTTLQRSVNYSDKGDLRFDYNFNANNSAFLRVSDLKQNATDFPLFGLPLDGNTNGKQRILDQQIALGYTRVIGANQLLDARLGLSRTKAGKFSLSIGNDPGFTFPGLPTDRIVAGGIPGINLSGFTQVGRQTTNPQFQNPAVMNPKVNYSWLVRNHSLKFGYEYQKTWMAVEDVNPLYGNFVFNGGFSAGYTGSATTGALVQNRTSSDSFVADLLFGAESQYILASYFVAHLRNQAHFAYVQDDWKVTPNLSLNLGVRYEYVTPYYEQKDQQSNFNPALANVGNGTGAIVPVTGTGNKYGYNPDKNDIAPRIGFAYAPNPNFSIRGGYGISFSHFDRAGSGNVLAINPPQALFSVSTVQAAPIAGGNAAAYQRLDAGFPASTLTFNPLTDNTTYIDGNRYRDSYVHSYYVSFQRQLRKNSLVDVAYVGNHALKLLQFINANQADPTLPQVNNRYQRPYPLYGDITQAIHEANGNYNAIQVKYEQQMTGGLTLLNSFAYSHTLDNAGASLESATPSPQDARNLRGDYGNSDYNQPLINTTSLVYELPVGQGRRYLNTGGIVNAVLGQWQISAVNQAQSGFQYNLTYTPTSQYQVSGIAASFRGSNLYRPNVLPGQPLISKGLTTGTARQFVNLAALQIPTAATAGPFGNLARNAFRTPPINTLNLTFNKRFATPVERLNVEFRGELYNAFNHVNFAIPTTALSGSTGGGRPTAGGAATATLDPRIVQFGLKLLF